MKFPTPPPLKEKPVLTGIPERYLPQKKGLITAILTGHGVVYALLAMGFMWLMVWLLSFIIPWFRLDWLRYFLMVFAFLFGFSFGLWLGQRVIFRLLLPGVAEKE